MNLTLFPWKKPVSRIRSRKPDTLLMRMPSLKPCIYTKRPEKTVIADDSGLEVEALSGAPGIYSARYAGEDANDKKNNQKLLEELKDIPKEKRDARFVCAIAVVMEDGQSFIVRGTVEGFIGFEPKGENGFGYDPLFVLPQYEKTMAQLTSEEKNKISHRGKALLKMVDELKKRVSAV